MKKILLIGDICTDIYQYGVVERISPEAPVPVFKVTRKEVFGGMADNVRLNLISLGCEVNSLFPANRSTKTRFVDERSKQHIVRVDDDVRSPACSKILMESFGENFDAVVISDYNKGYLTYESIEFIIQKFKCPIFIDTKKTDLIRFEAPNVFIKINHLEYMAAESWPIQSTMIITHGEGDVYLDSKKFPTKKVGVVDVCGAGDTFLAALTYEYLQKNNIQDAIRFAIKASSVTIQHMGVYSPTLEEIEAVK